MSEPIVQVIILTNKLVLVSKISEVLADIGEPDCRLISPYEVVSENSQVFVLKEWLKSYTDNNKIMISSDKILTLTEPNEKLLNEYLKITK